MSRTVTIVVRTPWVGDAGDFFIEGIWENEKDVEYASKKGFTYDVLTIPVNASSEETGRDEKL